MFSTLFLLLIIFNLFVLLCFSLFSSVNMMIPLLKMISSMTISSFLFTCEISDMYSFMLFSLSSFWMWMMLF